MKTRFWVVFFSFFGCLLAQQIIIEPAPIPTGGQVIHLSISQDGRLWVNTQGGTTTILNGGALLAQTDTSAYAPLQLIDSAIRTDSFEMPGIIGNKAAMAGFYPGSGNTVILSPISLVYSSGFHSSNNLTSFKNLEYQASISPPSYKPLCTDYTGVALLPYISGSYLNQAGDRFLVGTDYSSSAFYKESGKVNADGTCPVSISQIVNVPVLQAWQQPSGSFLAQILINVDPINWITSEIGIVQNNTVTSRLIGTQSFDHPLIQATLCCDLTYDIANATGLVTYRTGTGGHAVLVKNGAMTPFYDNEDGNANQNIRAIALNGQWAVIGTSNASQFSVDKMFLFNTETKQHWLIAKPGDTEPDGLLIVWPGDTKVRNDGVVFFCAAGQGAITPGLYRATISGVTGQQPPVISSFTADPVTVASGNSATLSWQTTGAAVNAVSIDQGIGPVPASGTLTVSPTQTTTCTLLAANSAGSVMSTVTVTVTPAPRVPVITIAGDNTVITNGTQNFDTTLAANGWVAIFGSNLSASTLQADGSDGFPYILGNTTVALDDKPVQLSYVSPTQVNAHLPSATADGIHNLVVFFSGTPSKPKAVSVAAISPRLYPFASDSQTWAVVGTDADHPLHIGQNFILWGTGMGPTTCSDIGDNPAPTTKLCALLTSATATLAFGKLGAMAKPVFIGAAPGLTGVYRINGTLPPILDAGLVDVVLSLGGLYTTSTQLYVAPWPPSRHASFTRMWGRDFVPRKICCEVAETQSERGLAL